MESATLRLSFADNNTESPREERVGTMLHNDILIRFDESKGNPKAA